MRLGYNHPCEKLIDLSILIYTFKKVVLSRRLCGKVASNWPTLLHEQQITQKPIGFETRGSKNPKFL